MEIFEQYFKLSGYDIVTAGQYLKSIQSFSSDQFIEWQNDKKWEIARYHFENNDFYNKKVGNKFPTDWNDLPILEKKDFQIGLEKTLSKGFNRKNTYVANISGSSGHPFFFAKNKEAHAMDWALIKHRYSWYDLKINSKQARFYGTPLEFWAKQKEKLKDIIMNRTRFHIFDMSDSVLEHFLRIFNKKKFNYIYGYTNSLDLFAKFLNRNNIVLKDICPSIKYCITTSELLTNENRISISKAFGVKVLNEYGASEVGLIAFERSDGRWLLSDEILFTEIIKDDNSANNIGNIIITDFDNLAMPFIKYNIGDMGNIGDSNIENTNCRELKNMIGRQNDNIILPSGKKTPGLTFYYISRSILESSGILKEFIIKQKKIDTFEFDIVSDRKLTENEITNIENRMHKYLEPNLKLVVNRVEKIERPRSGKIKHFYSEILK